MKNKHIILFISLLFNSLVRLMSQSSTDAKVMISAGIGYPANAGITLYSLVLVARESNYEAKIYNWQTYYFKTEFVLKSPKFVLGLNYARSSPKFSSDYVGFRDPLTGIYYEDKFTRSLTMKSSSFIARLNYHFNPEKKADSYIAIGTGFRYVKYIYSDTNKYGQLGDLKFSATAIPIALEAIYGIRYYFSDNVGIYTEIGIAKSIVQSGLVVRF